jgi:hypothetical protein
MDCKETRRLFDDYLDDRLAPERLKSVEEHLASCRSCCSALHDMKKTVEYLRDIGQEEPPPWLAQKVMAQVRSGVPVKKGIMQRLFYPLRLKLPLEVAATVLIAITALYVFRGMQQNLPVTGPHSEIPAPQSLYREEKPALAAPSHQRRHEPPAGKVPAVAQEESPQNELSKRETRPEGGIAAKDEARKAAGQASTPQFGKAQTPSPPSPERRETETSVSGRLDKKTEAREPMTRSAESAAVTGNARGARTVVVVRVPDTQAALRNIEDAVSRLGGTAIRKEAGDRGYDLNVRMPGSGWEDFLKTLKDAGEMERKGGRAAPSGKYIEITVELRELS